MTDPAPVRAHWLTVERLTIYPRIFLSVFILVAAAWDTHRNGWRRGEREILVAAWLMPIVGTVVATATGLPLGIVCLIAVFALSLRRVASARGTTDSVRVSSSPDPAPSR